MSLSGQSTTTATLNILDLNDDAFLSILSWLSFDDLAKIRLVTKYDFYHGKKYIILIIIPFIFYRFAVDSTILVRRFSTKVLLLSSFTTQSARRK